MQLTLPLCGLHFWAAALNERFLPHPLPKKAISLQQTQALSVSLFLCFSVSLLLLKLCLSPAKQVNLLRYASTTALSLCCCSFTSFCLCGKTHTHSLTHTLIQFAWPFFFACPATFGCCNNYNQLEKPLSSFASFFIASLLFYMHDAFPNGFFSNPKYGV